MGTQYILTLVTMKFHVEVETDSSLYETSDKVTQDSKSLHWDIQVEVNKVKLFPEKHTELGRVNNNVEQQQQKVEREEHSVNTIHSKTSLVPNIETSTSRSMEINVETKRTEAASAVEMAEARKLSRLLNTRGRKVSRQGEWLVFTERVGVLTTQNGVQQIREERVRINSDDLADLIAMDFKCVNVMYL